MYVKSIYYFYNYATFANMGRKTRTILYAAVTLTVMLLMADIISFGSISNSEILLNSEFPDFSRHCEQSPTHYFENEVMQNEVNGHPVKLEILRDSVLFANPDFTHGFNSKVWQPPKNS